MAFVARFIQRFQRSGQAPPISPSVMHVWQSDIVRARIAMHIGGFERIASSSSPSASASRSLSPWVRSGHVSSADDENAQFEAFKDELASLPYGDIKDAVEEHLHGEVLELLQVAHTSFRRQHPPGTHALLDSVEEGVVPPELVPETAAQLPPSASSIDASEQLLEENDKKPFEREWALEVRESSIPGVDRGVHVRGTVRAGSVVCLFPGMIFYPEHWRASRGFLTAPRPVNGQTNEFMTARLDSVVMDAGFCVESEGGLADVKPSSLNKGMDPVTQTAALFGALPNPFAVGHFLNHPPVGTEVGRIVLPEEPKATQFASRVQAVFEEVDEVRSGEVVLAEPPNLQQLPFELSEIPLHLCPFVPYKEFRPSSVRPGIAISGLAYMALRDITDEELYVNYRLNPLQYPAWYHPVDPEEDARRWSDVSPSSQSSDE